MERRSFLKLGTVAGLMGATGVNVFGKPSTAAPSFKLGLITDEADANLAHVLHDFLPQFHLHWVELRDVAFDGKGVYLSTQGSAAQVAQVKQQLTDAGVRLSMLDTGIYKIPLPGTQPLGENAADLNKVNAHFHEQLEQLKRAADVAHHLGTDKLRVFSFLRVAHPETIFNRVVDELNKALEVAQRQDVHLVLENEFDCNVATGEETARLLHAIPNRRLWHNWDPGNCFAAGEDPFPTAWNKLDHSRIHHIHLKDAVWLPGHKMKWMPIGGGKIDFVGQFKALKAMNYQHTLSLETHYRNAANNRWDSTVESMQGLMKVLAQV